MRFVVWKNIYTSELQIHSIAAGHNILHVFHADWLRKLSTLILETIELDVDNEGLWLYELLSSLDEIGISF